MKKWINGCLAAVLLLGSLALPIGDTPVAHAEEATASDIAFEQANYGTLVAQGYVENPVLGSVTTAGDKSWNWAAGTYYKYAKSIEVSFPIPAPNNMGSSEYYVVMEAGMSTYGFGGNGVTSYTRYIEANDGTSTTPVWADPSNGQAVGASNYSAGTRYQVVKINGGLFDNRTDAKGNSVQYGTDFQKTMNNMKISWSWGSSYYESMKSMRYRVYRKEIQPTAPPVITVSPSENFHTGNNNTFTIQKPTRYANYFEGVYGKIQYRLNYGPWINYTLEDVIPVKSEGSVVIQSRLVTQYNNGELESPYGQAYSRQDNSPPSVPNFRDLDSTKWYKGGYDLYVDSGTDAESGVEGAYYSLFGATEQARTIFKRSDMPMLPKRIVAEGTTIVTATTRNMAGIESEVASGKINIDNTPPLAILTAPQGWVKSLSIQANGLDSASGMKSITLPSGDVVPGSQASYLATTNGEYPFVYSDVAGNKVTKSITITNIDDQKPTVSLSKNGTSYTDQAVSTEYTFADAMSGINIYKMYYKWSQSPDSPSTWDQATRSQDTLTQAQEGTWYLHLKAYDLADNAVEMTSAPFLIQKQPTAPKLSVLGTATDQMLLSWPLPSGSTNIDGWQYTVKNETTGKSWTVNYPTNQLLDDSLEGGTAYRYTITASNHVGTASSTSEVTGVTLPIATVHADVYASGNDYRTALVSIDPIRSATDYHITATNWTTQEVDADVTVTGNTYQAVSGLKPYTMYDFAIRGVNASGEGAAYHTTFLSLPDQVGGFQTVQIGTDTIALKWNTATRSVYGWNSVTDDTYYPLWRDNQKRYEGADPFFTDTGLSAGTEYNYSAAAANRTGEGTKATLSNVLTLPAPPTDLRQLSATRTSATIGVSMPQSADAIRFVLNGTGTIDTAGSKSSYTIPRLTSGTTYRAEVYARNKTGFSAPTTFIFTTLPDQPSAGGIEVKSIEERAVTFHVKDIVPGATKYKLSIAGKDYELGAGDYTVTDLEAGTSYTYQFAAGNAAGYGEAVEGQVLTLPAAPTDYTVTDHTPTTLSLTWAPVKSATAYEVMDANGQLLATVSTPLYQATGLTPGATAGFQVLAVNDSGKGAASHYAFRTLPGFDSAIDETDLVHIDPIGVHEATLSWMAVPGADQYRIYDDHHQLLQTVAATQTVLEQLESAVRYTDYTVVPVNSTGEGKAMKVPSWVTLPDNTMDISYESTRDRVTLLLQHQLHNEQLVIASQGTELYRGSIQNMDSFMQDRLSAGGTYTFSLWTENELGQASKPHEIVTYTKKERVQPITPPAEEAKPVTEEPTVPEQETPPVVKTDNDKKKTFIDINKSFAKNSINRLADLGVVQGVSEELYAPQQGTTRAEFMAMLTRLTLTPDQIQQANSDPLTFTDVDPSGWYMPELKAAIHYGIARGFSKSDFAPEQAIDREQAAKMLSGALYSLVPEAEGDFYADSALVSPWAKSEVNGLTVTEIVQGYPDQTFRPHANLTRAESAAMIDRAMQGGMIAEPSK